MPRPPRTTFVLRPLALPLDRPTLPRPSLDDPNVKLDTVWIEDDLGDAWIAAYRLTAQDGVPVIAELRVFPREADEASHRPGEWAGAVLGSAATVPPGGLTARLVRQLRPGDTAQAGIAAWSRRLSVVSTAAVNLRRAGFRALKHASRVSRRGWPEDTLALAAQFYVETAGHHPVKNLAKAWRLKSHAQARDLLQAARDKGFLTPGRHGVKSRMLTDKARERLAALAQEKAKS